MLRKGLKLVFLVFGFVMARPCGIQAQEYYTNWIASVTLSPLPNSDVVNLFLDFDELLLDTPPTNAFGGPIIAITNCGTNVPVTVLAQGVNRVIETYSIAPHSNSLSETYTYYTANGSYDWVYQVPPFYRQSPQSQPVFVGSNATFSARVLHAASLQWQKDGANLSNDGHFFGVTNSTLTISNVTLADAGVYGLAASNPPANPATNAAVLSVFKPIQLALAKPAPGVFSLIASNADASPFEAQRVDKVSFYSSPDPSLGASNWTIFTNAVKLTNGVLQMDLGYTGSSNQFWISVEQP